ncbi:Gonadotropin-releasing hormone II receptor [Orchesella cincta]|uniref:Gonadotropin-releasing hormone II receptor n=1 Tax=Orchesella cincta TaxID=48709 RepID=A0A1D2MM35_ORCCI|nr:Gonadotropin-releasing hormone II receptor [Orchesella cincta]
MNIWFANENESNFELPFNFNTQSGSVLRGSDIDSNELPDVFTKVAPGAYPCIIAYAVVFLVAAVGNMIEFLSVWRRLRKRSTAMNRLLLHLCIADIMVVFMVAAVEIFWRISIGWYAGDFMCKLVQYFRAFGLYLSSLMLICLSLDRFYAVCFPLRAVDASRRVKIMLIIAWTAAALCAAPQCIVFRVQSHPDFPAFRQCNSILSGVAAEAINTAISMSFMYFLPILVIIFSYGNIIIRLARESDGALDADNNDRFLRRSGASVMDRAKIKTLKLSFVIVMVFIFCWTPYVVISIW